MAKIRLSDKDRKEFAKLTKNAKAKIRNVNKKYGVNLEGEVEFKKIDEFQTRAEFNKWKQQQASFTNRNNLTYQFVKNEFGVVASKSKILKMQRENKIIQRNVDKEIKRREKMPFISGGKVQGTVGQRMLQMARPMDLHRPKDFDFRTIKTQQRLHDLEEKFRRKSDPKHMDKRSEKMRDLFIETLERTFNSDADELIRNLRSMSVRDFYDLYQAVDEFDFDYYDPSPQDGFDGEDEGNKLRNLRALEFGYDRYMMGFYGPSLKDF
jgi:Phi-29 DNA terminal protein GP3